MVVRFRDVRIVRPHMGLSYSAIKTPKFITGALLSATAPIIQTVYDNLLQSLQNRRFAIFTTFFFPFLEKLF